jgi:hypothetical protein
MSATIRQRQVLARLATAPTAEQRAALARDFERRYRRPLDASIRFELDRAAQIDAQLQADALLARVRAAGQTGCAEPTERELELAEIIRILTIGLLAITALLAFGWLLREPVARLLVVVGLL